MNMKRALSYLALALGLLCAVPVGEVLFGLISPAFWMLIAAHVLTAIFGAAGFYLLTSEKKKMIRAGNVWWVFASAMCIAIPFWGIITAVVIYAIQGIAKKKPPPIVSEEIAVPGAAVFKKPLSKIRELEILERIDIEPFLDIFRIGRPELKKSAIKLLGSIRSKAAIKALGKALLDKDIEVRLFASGVINMIDDDFAEKIEEKKKICEEKPENVAAAVELAKLYLTYADSGLLDNIQSRYYYHWVIKLLAELPVSAETCYPMARAFNEIEEYNKAQECIDICLLANPFNALYNEMHCRNLFAKRQYTALYPVVKKMNDHGIEPVNKEPVAFWT